MITTNEFLKNYDDLNDLLFGFAMRLTRDKNDASDLMQETVCRAFKNKDRFRQGTNFKAWMTTIMRNSYINKYRKKKTRKTVEAPVDDFVYSIESKENDSRADSSIMLDDLTRIVHSLSDTYRIPFLMSFRGFQYNEIAEHLNIPIGTVKSRINYARKLMKEKIKVNYGELRRAA